MKISCAICLQSLIEQDSISIPGRCGHTFHSGCLSQWLKNVKTCPQCRVGVNLKNNIRIYLNSAEPNAAGTDPDADPEEMSRKIDDLAFKIREKDSEITKCAEEISKITEDLENKNQRVKCLEGEADKTSVKISVLREEVIMLRKVNKNIDQMHQMNEDLKEKIDKMKHIEEIMECCATEVEDKFKSITDHRVLGTLLVNLKRELKNKSDQFHSCQKVLSSTQKELRVEKKLVIQLQDKITKLEGDVYDLESNQLNKPEPLLPKSPPTSDIIRSSTLSVVKHPEPSQHSDSGNTGSPWLNIKSSSVGLAPLKMKRAATEQPPSSSSSSLKESMSILKKPRLVYPLQRTVPSNLQPNGFGGSDRKENTEFPLFGPTRKTFTKGKSGLHVRINTIELD